MNDVFEYRHAPGKGPIWLSAFGVVLLVMAVLFAEAYHLMPLVWVTCAVTLAWMLVPKPVYGIKVDGEYLVLSAWRKPRFVRLDDIAYLRASNVSEETMMAIVYKDGEEEASHWVTDLLDRHVYMAGQAMYFGEGDGSLIPVMDGRQSFDYFTFGVKLGDARTLVKFTIAKFAFENHSHAQLRDLDAALKWP